MFNRWEGITISIFIFTNLIPCSFTYFAIEQCPGTVVDNIRHQTEFNDISLIFYYTQWSKESLEALNQFNDVAVYLGDKAYFATVDCWHLACNCSKTVSSAVGSGSPHKWPTLMVHYGRIGQLKIQYNGLFTFIDMLKFIMNVMQPLERIERREDLNRMISATDGIVLGVFKTASSFEYKHYLIAALKWLEHDPIRTYRFTIMFVSAKENFNDGKLEIPNLLLLGHKTKRTFTEHSDFKWNASHILRWLHEEFNNDYSLLHGYSTPVTIAQKIKRQPVLVVFVNEPQNFFLYMKEYYNNYQLFERPQLDCWSSKKHNIFQNSNFTESLKCFCDKSNCHYYNKDFILKNLQFYYEINEHFELYRNYPDSTKSSLCFKPILEIQALLNFFQSTRCLLEENNTLQTSHIRVVKRLEDYLANEQCKSCNRSLAVVLLDTQRYKDFLENFDISPTYQSLATVFIIDKEKENMYIMDDRFEMNNLMEFVKKFYSNVLTNYYKNKKNSTGKLPLLYPSMSSRDYDIELKELNRVMFLNRLQYTHNQTLVVLIYSPDCALCGNIQHSFMQLSLSLRHIDDVKFIRLNTMDNDFPWQFNMPFLPALLVFAENRFSESRLFPTHLKPDMRNVFGFILSQLPAQKQIRLILAMCQSGTLPLGHTQSCWQFAKTILMKHIGKHLQYWQMFEAERSVIFERLRVFKDMSLDIQRNLRL